MLSAIARDDDVSGAARARALDKKRPLGRKSLLDFVLRVTP
jgi:hypothetical protein